MRMLLHPSERTCWMSFVASVGVVSSVRDELHEWNPLGMRLCAENIYMPDEQTQHKQMAQQVACNKYAHCTTLKTAESLVKLSCDSMQVAVMSAEQCLSCCSNTVNRLKCKMDLQ